MTDNLALAKSVGATVVEGGVLFVGYEQLEKYTQAAIAQGKRQPLTAEYLSDLWRNARTATGAFTTLETYTAFAREIETAHEIKA